MRRAPHRPSVTVSCGLVLAALVAPWAPATARADPSTVATVGDTILTRADLERVERRPGFPRVPGRGPAPETRARALLQLVNETLLAAEIERRGIVVEDREIEDRLAAIVQGLSARKSSLDQLLATTGLDRDGLRRQVRFEAGLQRLTLALRTPEVVEEISRARRREFDGTRLRVSHIILRPDGARGEDPLGALMPRARGIREAITSGATTFAAAAAVHSAGPSRHRGGDIGFIPRHGECVEEFARACFRQEPGTVSEPFRSPLGVHLITVTDVDEGDLPPDRYRAQIEAIAAEISLGRLLEDLRRLTTVTLEPGFEMARPRDPAELP